MTLDEKYMKAAMKQAKKAYQLDRKSTRLNSSH